MHHSSVVVIRQGCRRSFTCGNLSPRTPSDKNAPRSHFPGVTTVTHKIITIRLIKLCKYPCRVTEGRSQSSPPFSEALPPGPRKQQCFLIPSSTNPPCPRRPYFTSTKSAVTGGQVKNFEITKILRRSVHGGMLFSGRDVEHITGLDGDLLALDDFCCFSTDHNDNGLAVVVIMVGDLAARNQECGAVAAILCGSAEQDALGGARAYGGGDHSRAGGCEPAFHGVANDASRRCGAQG